MVPPNNLGPDLAGKPVNETLYKEMIGSLMYLKGTPTFALYYPKCPGFDLKGYSDLDYAGCNMDRKSTSGACQILGGKLVCWSAMKQQSVAMSSAEAEYVAAPGCCASILWMKSQLSNYDNYYKMVPIFCDNTSAIVVYQNFLREFWSTVVAFDSFPSTDEPEKCSLKEFLIKFSVLNGQRPLSLDFQTFCSSNGFDYNNGKYVEHPTPKVIKKELGKIAINPSYLDKTPVLKNFFPMAWRILFTFVIQVLGDNYSSTKQVNFIQQLLAYSLITRTEVDIGEIIYSDLITKLLNKLRLKYVHILDLSHVLYKDLVSPPPLAAKPEKGKSQTVTYTSPQSQGPEASGALSKKSKRSKSKKPPTETKRDIQLASTRLPSTLDEGTRKSKPLPEGTATHPKDSKGNKQSLDRDITFMTPDEGMTKTTPHPEGSLGDKDSGETNHPLIWNHYTPLMMISQGLVLSTRRTRPNPLD
nr:uncharacterized mitochondrial protein AtMg00810-like [Tanacetum cinerariifolium]